MLTEPVSRGEYRVNVAKLDRTGTSGILIRDTRDTVQRVGWEPPCPWPPGPALFPG